MVSECGFVIHGEYFINGYQWSNLGLSECIEAFEEISLALHLTFEIKLLEDTAEMKTFVT